MADLQELKKERDNLSPLPSSNDPYWDNSERIVADNVVMYANCEHSFVLLKPREAECKTCHWGIFLGLGDDIRDGHLYNNNKLVI